MSGILAKIFNRKPFKVDEPPMTALMHGDVMAWRKLWHTKLEDTPLKFSQVASLIFHFQGLRAILLFRLSHELWRQRIPVLPVMLNHINLTLHGLDIPNHVRIGGGLYMPHPVGTVIVAERVGSNVTLVSGVTIGMRHATQLPTIGSNVYIGTGARIFGKITVGNNANIGANAVILDEVPDNATAIGIPAKIVQKKPTPVAIS